MNPDTNDPAYFSLTAQPHCAPGKIDEYLRHAARTYRAIFDEEGGIAATVGDVGQIAWMLEEASREIRRLQLKCGELIEPVKEDA